VLAERAGCASYGSRSRALRTLPAPDLGSGSFAGLDRARRLGRYRLLVVDEIGYLPL
jgi:hypothetical protein